MAPAAPARPFRRCTAAPPAEIVAAMQAFRTGERPATVMDRIAKGFTDEETRAIAAWLGGSGDEEARMSRSAPSRRTRPATASPLGAAAARSRGRRSRRPRHASSWSAAASAGRPAPAS